MGSWLRTPKYIEQRWVSGAPPSTLVKAVYTAWVCSVTQPSDPEATSHPPLHEMQNCVPSFPVGFWQRSRKEQLMTLFFEPQKFPRIHHKQNVLGPERLIHLWTKEKEKFRSMIPLILTSVTLITVLSFQLLYGGVFWLNGDRFQAHGIGVHKRLIWINLSIWLMLWVLKCSRVRWTDVCDLLCTRK